MLGDGAHEATARTVVRAGLDASGAINILVNDGVFGGESTVLKLCEGRPPATKVRVDSVAAVEASGPLGTTLARTIVEGVPFGGRRYAGDKLRLALAGDDEEAFALPDGSKAVTRLIASGELEAARRASRAPNVVAAFPAVPGGFFRFAIPAMAPLLAIPTWMLYTWLPFRLATRHRIRWIILGSRRRIKPRL